MKKSYLAIGLTACLAAAWTGGAWYTGKLAEAEILRQIEVYNSSFKKAEYSVKYENVKINRGVFTSTFQYDLKIEWDNNQPYILPLEGTLYHGPLPLNQIGKLNLVPSMFSSTVQLSHNELTKKLFESSQGKQPLSSEFSVSYSQNIKGKVDIAAGEYQSPDLVLRWTENQMDFDTDKNGVGKYDIKVGHIYAKLEGEVLRSVGGVDSLQAMTIDIDGIKIDSDTKATDFVNLNTGDILFKADSLKYGYYFPNEQSSAEFKQLAVTLNAQKKQDFMDYKIGFQSENFMNNHLLGKSNLQLQAKHLKSDLIDKIIEISKTNSEVPGQLFGDLLKYQPQIIISPFTVSNEKGLAIDGNLNVELGDFERLSSEKFLEAFKQLSLNVQLDKDALKYMMAQYIQAIELINSTEANDLAQATLDDLVSQSKGILEEKENKLSLNLNLAEKGVNFNGEILDEQSLGLFFIGMMMMLNQ